MTECIIIILTIFLFIMNKLGFCTIHLEVTDF